MNTIPTFSRACVHSGIPFRLMPTKPQRMPQQLRTLTASATSQAQPIELTSSTTPASPSESSTLASSILSRASTDADIDQTAQPSSLSGSSSSSSNTSLPRKNSLSTSSPFLLLGTVSRTGTMASTVQITSPKQTFDTFLQKHYTRPSRLLAHDPHPSGFLHEGDVVEYGLFSPAEQAAREEKRLTLESRLVEKGVIRLKTRRGKERNCEDVGVKKRGPKWVVRRVVTPFGISVAEREEALRVRREAEEEEMVKRETERTGAGRKGRGARRQQQQQQQQQLRSAVE